MRVLTMKRVRLLPLLVLGLVLGANGVSASHISLQVKTTTHFRAGRVRLDVTVENLGDEPARDVRVAVHMAGLEATGGTVDFLDVGASCASSLDVPMAGRAPGTHTAAVAVHYADLNGHPFTALSSAVVVTGDPSAPELVEARLSHAELVERGTLTLDLTSLGEATANFSVALHLPDELNCETPLRRVRLAAGENRTLEFPVRNRGALPGSVYGVFAVIESEDGGIARSRVAHGAVTLGEQTHRFVSGSAWWLLLIVPLALAFAACQTPLCLGRGEVLERMAPWLVLAALTVFIVLQLGPSYLLLDTTLTGGDTPAHNYLAGHLRTQLLEHGRIISWAPGWWCGFPMFQYYFVLPYLLTVLLSLIVPMNIALKLVTVLALLLLPPAAYAAARILRTPRPTPSVLAVATLPFLFVQSHTMWGASVYSLLAGMIANSLSFPIMLLFIACAYRDADDGRFRLRTPLLLAALVASHFFTSVMAALAISAIPFVRPRAGFRRAISVLARECALGMALMAWWLVPLVVKMEFSVQYGTNWDVKLLETLPRFALLLSPLAVWGAVEGLRRGQRLAAAMTVMLAVGVVLFQFGSGLAAVFVNVRLWPFVFFALLALEGLGLGLLLAHCRMRGLALATLTAVVLVYGVGHPAKARAWAKWNYEGLERKGYWPVLSELVLPLRGTPGRLANDLHEDNDRLGSTRVFESVPYLTGKPIVEGGIVGSALGSLFAYRLQGETSRASAGFPNILTPAAFDMEKATRHLELANVKHFIARWSETQQALDRMPQWRFLRESRGWKLYELTTHEGRHVFIPRRLPLAVVGGDLQRSGLDWLYTDDALDTPFAFPSSMPQDDGPFPVVLSESEFKRSLAEGTYRALGADVPSGATIRWERVTDDRICFQTSGVGLPHIIKCTYYPNWKVKGAPRVYPVTPFFMLVYPTAEDVELYYGSTLSDNIGRAATAIALLVLCAAAAHALRGIVRPAARAPFGNTA